MFAKRDLTAPPIRVKKNVPHDAHAAAEGQGEEDIGGTSGYSHKNDSLEHDEIRDFEKSSLLSYHSSKSKEYSQPPNGRTHDNNVRDSATKGTSITTASPTKYDQQFQVEGDDVRAHGLPSPVSRDGEDSIDCEYELPYLSGSSHLNMPETDLSLLAMDGSHSNLNGGTLSNSSSTSEGTGIIHTRGLHHRTTSRARRQQNQLNHQQQNLSQPQQQQHPHFHNGDDRSRGGYASNSSNPNNTTNTWNGIVGGSSCRDGSDDSNTSEQKKKRRGIGGVSNVAGGGISSLTMCFAPTNSTKRKLFSPFGRYVQTCLIAAVPAYLMGLFLFLHFSNKGSNHSTFNGIGSYYDVFDSNNSFFYDARTNTGNHLSHPYGVYSSDGAYGIRNKNTGQIMPDIFPANFYQKIHELQDSAVKFRQLRHSQIDQKYWSNLLKIQQNVDDEAQSRKSRTTPPSSHPSTPTDSLYFQPYLIQSSIDTDIHFNALESEDSEHLMSHTKTTPKNDKPAPLEEICGFHAQKAALNSPGSFKIKDSLAKSSSRKVRVLITGILSSPLGYRLAHVLKQRCNVNILIAFDSMYPNTLANRLFYQEQTASLTKLIPKLVRPFFVGHVGLDPAKHAKNFIALKSTNELDIVQTFQPTHIVHLSMHNSDHVYLNNDLATINTQSPYTQRPRHVTSQNKTHNSSILENLCEVLAQDVPSASESTSPMFALKNGMVSMEQILSSIAGVSHEDRPHFIYASSSLSDTSLELPRKTITGAGCASMIDHASTINRKARKIDEILADYYNRQHDVFSIGLRLPTVYGPWDHRSSPISQILNYESIRYATDRSKNNGNSTASHEYYNHHHHHHHRQNISKSLLSHEVDLMYVDDVVDAIIAAMQYRPLISTSSSRSTASSTDSQIVSKRKRKLGSFVISLSSGQTRTIEDVQHAAKEILKYASKSTVSSEMIDNDEEYDSDDTTVSVSDRIVVPVLRQNEQGSGWYQNMSDLVNRTLGWSHHTSYIKGLAHTLSWHMDRIQPYGPPPPNTPTAVLQKKKLDAVMNSTTPGTSLWGENVLEHLSLLRKCDPNDILCLETRPVLPCASECASHKPKQCVPTFFDELIPLVQELTMECDIVLYTQYFDKHATDLELSSEFLDEGHPAVCNFAFINRDSNLTASVVEKVPDEQLKGLDFRVSPDTQHRSIRERKLDALNGRLLYRGWILIWSTNTPDQLDPHTESLLKLSPGRFFHSDVKTAVFIDQLFRVSPKADDIAFLAHEMYRSAWEPRVVKRKNRPKAKLLIPAEPERQAVVLLSELKYQDSPDSARLPPEEKITNYEATRFMRYECGEKTPLAKEPQRIKSQREFYGQVKSFVNHDGGRSPNDPSHKFELKNWVRTRWVAHDLRYDVSRTQIRCPWYEEHVFWGSPLDQLTFAYVIHKLDLLRKLDHDEPDDTIFKQMVEKIELKKSLSDTFEWISLHTLANKHYSPYDEMRILPYDLDYVTDAKKEELLWPVEQQLHGHPHPPISDAKDKSSTHDAYASSLEITDDQDSQHHRPLLFVRVISDRIMAFARKRWNNDKKQHHKTTSAKQHTK